MMDAPQFELLLLGHRTHHQIHAQCGPQAYARHHKSKPEHGLWSCSGSRRAMLPVLLKFLLRPRIFFFLALADLLLNPLHRAFHLRNKIVDWRIVVKDPNLELWWILD